MNEEQLEIFAMVAGLAFCVLLISAIVLAITHWLFGMVGVGIMLGILVVALFLGYIAALFLPEDI